jgi:hypothetical protein
MPPRDRSRQATLLIQTNVAGQAGGPAPPAPSGAALKIHPLSGRFRARGGCANVRHPPDKIAS